MLKFDIVKVKNYAEDIDSLLTFVSMSQSYCTCH